LVCCLFGQILGGFPKGQFILGEVRAGDTRQRLIHINVAIPLGGTQPKTTLTKNKTMGEFFNKKPLKE